MVHDLAVFNLYIYKLMLLFFYNKTKNISLWSFYEDDVHGLFNPKI